MTLDERIEAAAKHLLGDARPDSVEVARETLKAAFPELFDGTGWIAPTAKAAVNAYRNHLSSQAK